MFSERIKELRLSLGISQVEFAKRLYVTKQCISNWENGNITPSMDMLIRIAKKFSVSADYLLGLNDVVTLDVTGLTTEQILHLRNIVSDFNELNEQKST